MAARSKSRLRRGGGNCCNTRTVNPSSSIYGAASRNSRSSQSSWFICSYPLYLIWTPVGKHSFQFLAASKDIRFHCTKRDVENTSSLIVGKTVLATKYNRGAFIQRK